jgi:cytochrome c oxidase cbb3-type subunit 2
MRPSKLHESLDAAASLSSLLRFENFVTAAFFVVAAVLSSGWKIRFAQAQAGEVSPGGSDTGQLVYDLNCAVCHGVQGATAMGSRHPCFSRDRAISVPASSNFVRRLRAHCPLTRIFLQTVTHGLRWAGMIGRPDLSESDRIAVVRYIKTFSPRFATVKPLPSISVAHEPRRTSALVTQGRELFRDARFVACQGAKGRGDGSSAGDMKDDWGWPIRPGDLTWRPLKRGSALEQIYLTIVTGLSGTPMPGIW